MIKEKKKDAAGIQAVFPIPAPVAKAAADSTAPPPPARTLAKAEGWRAILIGKHGDYRTWNENFRFSVAKVAAKVEMNRRFDVVKIITIWLDRHRVLENWWTTERPFIDDKLAELKAIHRPDALNKQIFQDLTKIRKVLKKAVGEEKTLHREFNKLGRQMVDVLMLKSRHPPPRNWR